VPARLRSVVPSVAAIGLCAGAALAGGLLYADSSALQDSPDALRRALGVEQRITGTADADLFERLAELDPERAKAILEESLELDPRRGSGWIELGLLAEREQDAAGAERALLEAARCDRRYLPAWTLANFYARRGNQAAFWEWAGRAAGMSFDDFPPLLRLAERFEPDPLELLARLGTSSRMEREYLGDLMARRQFNGAQQVAMRLAERHDPGDAPRFATLASRHIEAGNADAALAAWNVFHAPPLDPAQGRMLTDPEFRDPSSGDGFDWIWSRAPCPGVAAAWTPGELRFEFSGAQPEDCALLTQTLPVRAAQRYRLSFEYRSSGPPSGFDWDFDRSEAGGESGLVAADSWRVAERVFGSRGQPGSGVSLARLRFRYRRPPGTVRFQGAISIRGLKWEAR